MTAFETLHRVQQNLRLAIGVHEIGSLLWWQLNGSRIGHSDLVAAAERHGLDTKYVPGEIKPVSAFRRAMRHASTRLPIGLLLRPVLESKDELVIALVKEEADAARRDLDYDVLCLVTFRKDDAEIAADRSHNVVAQIRELFTHHQAHTSEDIRSMMTAFLSDAGVSLRDSGGVYFTPASFTNQLAALCRVVEDVGHNRTFVLPIFDTPETKATLRDVAERTLDEEIRTLEEELAAFDFDKVRDATLERRLDLFEQLRGRASLFAGVLAFKVDTLNERILAMQASIRRHLGVTPLPENAPSGGGAITVPAHSTSAAFASEVGF